MIKLPNENNPTRLCLLDDFAARFFAREYEVRRIHHIGKSTNIDKMISIKSASGDRHRNMYMYALESSKTHKESN